MKHQNIDRLLTRSEVEERFGISKRYLELAIGRGEGPRLVRVGRSVRYRVADIEAWIEFCAVDAVKVV
ncbi:AlpA family transcriptional regulator [Sulfitobacter sp. SK011]|uniref:helix-turn-helix transcriptional regulator n=1 Tax=Sulfitobacter sp. SK011 TaxID=1389004 RepID=UPI000E09F9B8|nr:helix-turn-helix domain-containing protein [Sulfitobacter sp. SK011]AXI43165.1 AlpA family transcriptional regulator [Sulfitobacter sp. SK011]